MTTRPALVGRMTVRNDVLMELRKAGVHVDGPAHEFYRAFAGKLGDKNLTGMGLVVLLDLTAFDVFRCGLEEIDPKLEVPILQVIDAAAPNRHVANQAKKHLMNIPAAREEDLGVLIRI